MILLAPYWQDKVFWRNLLPMVARKYFYPAGKHIFEETGVTKWPVWALLLDGTRAKKDQEETKEEEEYRLESVRTNSSRRRWRRK